jgi:hypothetical protein
MWRRTNLVWTDVPKERCSPPSSGWKNCERGTSVTMWLQSANAGSSLEDFSTLNMEAICSSEMSVDTRSTRRYIPEDGIFHSHRCEYLKSYLFYYLLYVIFLRSYQLRAMTHADCMNCVTLRSIRDYANYYVIWTVPSAATVSFCCPPPPSGHIMWRPLVGCAWVTWGTCHMRTI